jgi:ribonuclease HI
MQQVKNNEPGKAVIYTDSKITLDSLVSAKNHEHLVEIIRKRTVTLNKENWKIKFKWVKAHAVICGNETAHRLANEALQNLYVTYSRIPKSAIKKGDPGRKYKKMAESVGGNNKRSYY